MSKTYLIASLPYSGTRFMTAALKDMGVGVVHETHEFDTSKGDKVVVSGLHWDENLYKNFDVVIHQVRNPIAWMRTNMRNRGGRWPLFTFTQDYYKPIENCTVDVSSDHPEIKYLVFWLRANVFIENLMQPVWRFQIEDMHHMSPAMEKLCEIIEVGPRNFRVDWTKRLGNTENGKPWEAKFDGWPEVDARYRHKLEDVKSKAIEYGYII